MKEENNKLLIEEPNNNLYDDKKSSGDDQDLSIKEFVEISLLENNKKSILSETEQKILILRYGLDGGPSLTCEEIGKELGLSRERIRQFESRAFYKIRFNFGPNIFKARILGLIKETLNGSYKMLLDKMSYEEAAVYLIKKGLIVGVALTDKGIAELLNISLEQVEVFYQNAEIALSPLDCPKTLKRLNS